MGLQTASATIFGHHGAAHQGTCLCAVACVLSERGHAGESGGEGARLLSGRTGPPGCWGSIATHVHGHRQRGIGPAACAFPTLRFGSAFAACGVCGLLQFAGSPLAVAFQPETGHRSTHAAGGRGGRHPGSLWPLRAAAWRCAQVWSTGSGRPIAHPSLASQSRLLERYGGDHRTASQLLLLQSSRHRQHAAWRQRSRCRRRRSSCSSGRHAGRHHRSQ